jgi:hypothetical protein
MTNLQALYQILKLVYPNNRTTYSTTQIILFNRQNQIAVNIFSDNGYIMNVITATKDEQVDLNDPASIDIIIAITKEVMT